VTIAPPAYRARKTRLAWSEIAEPNRGDMQTGGSDMMTFIVFLNWTEQGREAFKDTQKRYQTAKSLVEKLGGRILSAYVTTGQYDLVVTLEMPNDEALAKYVLAAGAAGNVRTTTVRAFTIDAFAKIAADTPAFEA
jgi:uncharacterized protein with GYD domain